MSHNSNQKPQRGSVNYIWVLGGGYLLYTAFRLFQRLWTGETETVALNVIGGGFFAVVGAVMLWREWKAYQYGKAHMDDPSSWSMDSQEEVEEGSEPEKLSEQEDVQQ